MKKFLRIAQVILLISLLLAMPQPASAAVCTSPTQSSLTDNGVTYTVQTFTTVETNCTWTIPTGVISVDLFIVGGGGGAGFGACGGGGGAGRVIVSNSSIRVTPGASISLTVGSGGSGGYVGDSSGAGWRYGYSGTASSVTISAIVYSASGGGGGGGGSGGFNGLYGGSGGGGTACGTAGTGGSADNTTINGFTTYANSGATGNASIGGGGGGAGGAATNRDGGAGVSIWGTTVAGGGGGWPSGTGGSSIGGNATGVFSSKAASGSAGTAGTGSGGGGGNDGGSGRVAIRYIQDLIAPTFNSTTSFSIAENTSTTTNAAVINVSESATITISSGADAAAFNIVTSDSVTAFIRFKVSPDYEAPTDVGLDNIYNITISATDLAGNVGTQSITINVTDVVDTSSFNSLTISGLATYRQVVTITANVSVAAKVTFKARNVIISGCKNKLTTGSSPNIIATCSWRPSVRGTVVITATAYPTGAGITGSSATPVNVVVGNRNGSR